MVLVYSHEVISTESEMKLFKKRLVWLTGEFMLELEAVNSLWAKVIDFYSIFNSLKENAVNLDYYPILRRKADLYLFLSTNREWESYFCRLNPMLSTVATYDQGERCLSAVFFALLTCWHGQFSNWYLPSFFLHKLTSIYRQNWSWEKISKSQNNDKAASVSSVVVNMTSSVQKIAIVSHFTINHAVSTP